jgi:O-antigen/teichoic acid export membrane protein
VRVVLETLGAEDYGIYNVVAGVVTMFGFLSGTMAGAAQRYFSFELGRENYEQVNRLFNLIFMAHLLIMILFLILAETLGLWFINNKLVILQERRNAALWIYQTSIISLLFTILTTPYMALIIAHEDMNIYAYVSVIEVVLGFVAVFFLRFILLDKLVLYGILMCLIAIINTAVYRIICSIKYHECQFRFYWNKKLFKEITSYTGWNLIVMLADIGKKQTVTILLNQFFNPIIVLARSLASTLTNAVASFFNQFSMATRPQLIKSYAAGQYKEMLSLVFLTTKCNYFLMFIFALPFFLELQFVLTLWLKNPPEFVVLFTRLMLIDILVDAINYPIVGAASATGKVSLFQFVSAIIFVLNFPLSLLVLFCGAPAYSVFVIAIGLTAIAYIVRLKVLKLLIDISITKLIKDVIIPLFIFTASSLILPVIIHGIMDYGLPRLFSVIIVSIISTCTCMYFVGLNKEEKQKTTHILIGKIHALFPIKSKK